MNILKAEHNMVLYLQKKKKKSSRARSVKQQIQILSPFEVEG